MPDIESVVKISKLFQISLDELLVKEEKRLEEQKTQITLEDMARINLHNRRFNKWDSVFDDWCDDGCFCQRTEEHNVQFGIYSI